MARSRKGCDLCREDNFTDGVSGRNGFNIWIEIYPTNNLMAFMGQANDEEGFMMEACEEIQMNYCPVCGRKLIE